MPYNFRFLFKCDFCLFFLLSVGLKLQFFVFPQLCPASLSHQYQIASLRKLVRHSGVHVCIATTGKVCHFMFSVEKFAHVTCMPDDN